MAKALEFLYLTQEETMKAGMGNMRQCVEAMVETFKLVGQGDYLMGGPNGNSHGIQMHFGHATTFPSMPGARPDRKFMAMVGYLGGRFNMCGVKWFGSSAENLKRGLPRPIVSTMLNDPDTGAPVVLMPANPLSAMRTGAVAGVGAKYLARKNSETIGVVGAGRIARTCLHAILDVCKNVREVKVHDLSREAAERFSQETSKAFKVEVRPVEGTEAALRESDIVCCCTSGSQQPTLHEEWFKPGVVLLYTGSGVLSKGFLRKSKIVVDDWRMYEAWNAELGQMEGGLRGNLSNLAADMMELLRDGSLQVSDITNLGDVLIGRRIGRSNDQEMIVCSMHGMVVEDIAWGCTVFRNAQKMGLGTRLTFWEEGCGA